MNAPLRSIISDSHIVDTVTSLELALEDARAGNFSSVVIFADIRGEDKLKTYKSGAADRALLVGRLMMAIFDMCCERTP